MVIPRCRGLIILDIAGRNGTALLELDNKHQKALTQGFPGGAVVRNPPANAGDTGSSPWSGKIPHAVEQLSPCTTTTEPVL